MSNHKCEKCGAPAVCRMNASIWLCERCAEKVTIASLAFGQPVIEAVRGETRYLLIPTGAAHNNN